MSTPEKSLLPYILPITAVIPHKNRSADLLKCIESFHLLNYRPQLVVVIDDNSNESHQKRLSELSQYSNVRQIRLSKSVGAASAKNIGLHVCNTEYIWFLDSDTEMLFPDSLYHAFKAISNDAMGGVGGEIVRNRAGNMYFRDYVVLPNMWTQFRYHKMASEEITKQVPYVPTNNFLTKTSLLKKVNGFYPGMDIGEDKLASLRITTLGYILTISSRFSVLHNESPAGRIDNKEYVKKYYGFHAFIYGAVSSPLKLLVYSMANLISVIREIAQYKQRMRQINEFGMHFTSYDRKISASDPSFRWKMVRSMITMMIQYLTAHKLAMLIRGVKYQRSQETWDSFENREVVPLDKSLSHIAPHD